MLVLGIWSFGRNSAAVLVDDNSIVCAMEEEKLSRSPGAGGIPRLAIARCLELCGSRIGELKIAACPHRALRALLRDGVFRLRLTFTRAGGAGWVSALGRHFRELGQLHQLRRVAGGSTQLRSFEHHLCHAASAYYTSEFDHSLVLTLDECGDMWSGLLSVGEGDEIRLLRPLRFPNSLGWFYSRVTELLGLRAGRDEHKLQWLSKDGSPDFLPAFREVFQRNSDGFPILSQRYLSTWLVDQGSFSAEFLRELGLNPTLAASDVGVRAALASSAGRLLEEIVLEMVEHACAETKAKSLCVAGGVFQNVFLVRALEQQIAGARVHVFPVSGNSGTALGAALLARKQLGLAGRQPLSHLYLGAEFSSAQVKAVLDNSKVIYKYFSGEEQLFAETVQLLLRDRIVAWCQGRTEFGHRALGNRSILASPFSEYVLENVNQYIKHREDFHPFALSVPAEEAGALFDVTPNCRFMASLGSLKTSLPALERFSFRNREVRVHVVDREANPRFWRLLHKFGERAPAPVLINTSFNLFGEPLVSEPREAIRSFFCAGIDALVLGDFVVVK